MKCPLCHQETKENIIDPKRTTEAMEAHEGLHCRIIALETQNAALLAAARRVIDQNGHFYDCIPGKRGQPVGDGCSNVCKAFRAAIAKAEGRE